MKVNSLFFIVENHKSIKIPFSERKLNYFYETYNTYFFQFDSFHFFYCCYNNSHQIGRYTKWKSIRWCVTSVMGDREGEKAVFRHFLLSSLFWWQQWTRWIIKSNACVCVQKSKCTFVWYVCVFHSRNCTTWIHSTVNLMNLKQSAWNIRRCIVQMYLVSLLFVWIWKKVTNKTRVSVFFATPVDAYESFILLSFFVHFYFEQFENCWWMMK